MQVLPQKARPLSSFTNEAGMKLLLGPNYQEATTRSFPMADVDTLAKLENNLGQVTNLEYVEDLLSHLGVDLALRCFQSEPRLQSKEYAKRELISPLLYVAAVLAGKLRLCQLNVQLFVKSSFDWLKQTLQHCVELCLPLAQMSILSGIDALCALALPDK